MNDNLGRKKTLTILAVITFDDGARGVAVANFSVAYGYDLRGEVFGSKGMVTAGSAARAPLSCSPPTG